MERDYPDPLEPRNYTQLSTSEEGVFEKREVGSYWYTWIFFSILFIGLLMVTYVFLAPCLPKRCMHVDPIQKPIPLPVSKFPVEPSNSEQES